MNSLSSDSQQLLKFLDGDKKLTAMLAPSFAVDFEEHQIVGALKDLGFDHIVDHSLGIATVNKMYEAEMEKYPNKIFISANCPSTVSLVLKNFPSIASNLLPIFSPMVCMAKICKKTWPDNLNVFIGPCLSKKEEAKKYNEIALALTYKELKEVIAFKGMDLFSYKDTALGVEGFEDEIFKVFSTSGGVQATLKEGFLKNEEAIIADGAAQLTELFNKLVRGELDKNVRFLDVLFCDGGCIGGPGIVSEDNLNSRRVRLLEYMRKRTKRPLCSEVDSR